MNRPDKRIDVELSAPNSKSVALVAKRKHAIADAASGRGSHASHSKLILTYLDAYARPKFQSLARDTLPASAQVYFLQFFR